MKITELETFKVPPRCVFLKVTTNEGVTGWGEPIVEGRADTVIAAVGELTECLVGRDARRVEGLFKVLHRGGFYRGGPVLTSAISGIEQALWDITARSLGVPVYALLGGAARDRVRVYNWVGGDRPDAIREAVRRQREAGFTAVKTLWKNSTTSTIIARATPRWRAWQPHVRRAVLASTSLSTSTAALTRRWQSCSYGN